MILPAIPQSSVDLLVQNVTRLRRTLGVPLAHENISALLGWPDAEMTSAFTCRQQAVI